MVIELPLGLGGLGDGTFVDDVGVRKGREGVDEGSSDGGVKGRDDGFGVAELLKRTWV